MFNDPDVLARRFLARWFGAEGKRCEGIELSGLDSRVRGLRSAPDGMTSNASSAWSQTVRRFQPYLAGRRCDQSAASTYCQYASTSGVMVSQAEAIEAL